MTEREQFEEWHYDFAQQQPRPPNEWDIWQASRKQALEEAAQVADRTSNNGRLLLTVGELKAGEMRTAKAILSYVARTIRSLTTQPSKD